jgi:excisionase family DNA binding protein
MSRFVSESGEKDGSGPLTRENVLSVKEVAELLGIPRSTVHDLARRGLLPARRVGRRWLFLRNRIEAALMPLDDARAWRPGDRNGAATSRKRRSNS